MNKYTINIAQFIMAFKHQVGLRHCIMHRHNGLEIVYHALGSGIGKLETGEEVKFNGNSVVIYPPGIAHSQLNTIPGEDWCIILDITAISDLLYMPKFMVISKITSPFLRQELSRLADTKVLTDQNMQKTHDLRATALLLDLLSLAQQEHSTENDISTKRRIELAHEYIKDNFDLIKNIAEVSDYVNLSLDYTRHLFHETYGYSMKDFLMRIRINHAEHLLKHTPLPQKEIADRCGFNNIRYFSTRFKYYTGIAPGEYRKSIVDEENTIL